MNRFALLSASLCSALFAQNLAIDTIKITESMESDSITPDKVDIKVVEKGNSANLADFLKRESDVNIMRKSSFGDNGDVLSIRGLSSNRIMLNMDGRNLNASGINGGHYIDFGTIPLDNIEKIEVIKGGSQVEYGNNAMGGVINAYTKEPTEKPYISLYTMSGGWESINDYDNLRVLYSQKFGFFGTSIGASYQSADEYLKNNDFNSKNVNSKFYFDLPTDGKLIFGVAYNETKRGFAIQNRKSSDPTNAGYSQKIDDAYPLSLGDGFAGAGKNGVLSYVGDGANWVKKKYLLDATYRQPISDKAILELLAYKNVEDRFEKNYANTAFVPSATNGALVLDRKIESDRSHGYKAKADVFLDNHTLLAGYEHKLQGMGDIILNYADQKYNAAFPGNNNTPYTGKPGDQRVVMDGFFLSDTVNLGKFELYGGARYDTFRFDRYNDDDKASKAKDYDDGAISPKLGVTYKIDSSNILSAFLYKNYRTPGIPESYWHYNGVNMGNIVNEELKPETSDNAELIYKHKLGEKGFVKASVFYQDISDFIAFKFENIRGAYNIESVKLYGVTLDGVANISQELDARAALTLQRSKKEGDPLDTKKLTEEIDYIPSYKAVFGVNYRIIAPLTLSSDVNFIGNRVYQSSLTRIDELEAYATVDLNLKYKIRKDTEAELFVENLFDKKFEERFGYPNMGINGGIALKYVY